MPCSSGPSLPLAALRTPPGVDPDSRPVTAVLTSGIAVHERPVGLGLGAGADLGDRVAGLLDRSVEAHDAAVAEKPGRERAHLQVFQPGAGQVELGQDSGLVDDVVRRGAGVEPVTPGWSRRSGTRRRACPRPPARPPCARPGPGSTRPPGHCAPRPRSPPDRSRGRPGGGWSSRRGVEHGGSCTAGGTPIRLSQTRSTAPCGASGTHWPPAACADVLI